jgi:hypothetical protein
MDKRRCTLYRYLVLVVLRYILFCHGSKRLSQDHVCLGVVESLRTATSKKVLPEQAVGLKRKCFCLISRNAKFVFYFVGKALKVPKCEIFDRSDFPDFYTIKSLRVGDFGVKIKRI